MGTLALRRAFFRRAVRTYFKVPLASQAERGACEWTDDDLAVDFQAAADGPDTGGGVPEMLGALSEGRTFPHSRGRPFATHLMGVHDLLRAWKQPRLVALTGLCHSIYSTQQYPYGLRGYTERDVVRRIVGVPVEKLAFLFCSHDRVHLYEQALALARSGMRLPAEGLRLRNCLTGGRAVVPREVVSALLVVHVADVMDQMPFFNFDFVFGLLSVADGEAAGGSVLRLLRQSGFEASKLALSVDSGKGTFGLLALASRPPEIREAKRLVGRFLDGDRAPAPRDMERIAELSRRHPYILELKWLRLYHDASLDPDGAAALREEVRALYATWGTTWAKKSFERSSLRERMAALHPQASLRTG
jgi:hypothetical protein